MFPVPNYGPSARNDMLNKAEDFVDKTLRRTKHALPYLARLCLVSSFLEDGTRMLFQWSLQQTYMVQLWGVPRFVAFLFVLFNMTCQLIPSAMVLAKKKTLYASFFLIANAIIQTIAYNIIWDLRILLRILSMVGGILLLLVEETKASTSTFSGIPTSPSQDRGMNLLQLAGRILLILMFASILHVRLDVYFILVDVFGTVMMTLVTLGYKTKLSAIVLFAYLGLINTWMNPFWTVKWGSAFHDILRYDFFQTTTVMGGLLYIVMLGPGGVSIDERKKKW